MFDATAQMLDATARRAGESSDSSDSSESRTLIKWMMQMEGGGADEPLVRGGSNNVQTIDMTNQAELVQNI